MMMSYAVSRLIKMLSNSVVRSIMRSTTVPYSVKESKKELESRLSWVKNRAWHLKGNKKFELFEVPQMPQSLKSLARDIIRYEMISFLLLLQSPALYFLMQILPYQVQVAWLNDFI